MSKNFIDSTASFDLFESPFLEGSVVGSFRIDRKIGEGGMGIVYLATDIKIERQVAIKAILDHSNKANIKRFAREAKMIASLDHPNIVKAYSFFSLQDIPCMIMEFIEGTTLDECYKELSLEDKVRMVIKILYALDYAHSKGVIHRDLKPSNILVNKDGEPLIMDFGLAKTTQIKDKSLTKSGMVMGSCGYMSPEQVRGLIREVDHTSDIYSMGAVLYQLITGCQHIEADHIIGYMYKISHEQITPPSKHNKEIHQKLETITLKALLSKKQYRYQRAANFAKDLEQFLLGKPISAQRWKVFLHKNYTLVMSSILCVIVAIILVGGILFKYNAKIEEDLKTVQHWIERGFFENADKKLNTLYKEQKISNKTYLKNLLIAYSKLKNDSEFFKTKDLLNPSDLSELEEIEIAVAEGELYFRQEQWSKARGKLFPFSAEKKYPQIYACYFVGVICFQDEDYGNGIKNFKKVLELKDQFFSKKKTSFLYLPDTHYHLANHFFSKLKKKRQKQGSQFFTLQEKGLLQKILAHLKAAQLSKRPEWNKLIGEYHMNLKQYDKALEYLNKCISLRNDNSSYYVLRGTIYLEQKKVALANSDFEKALELDPENINAARWFARIALNDIDLMEYRYSKFIYRKKLYYPKNITSNWCQKIADENEDGYWAYKYFYKKRHFSSEISAKNFVKKFVEKLDDEKPKVSDLALKALKIKRYNENISSLLKEKPQIKDYLQKMCDKEKRQTNRYIMAMACMNTNSSILDEISVSTLVKILKEETNTFLRYLAATCLIFKHEFFKVEELRVNGNPNLQVICAHVLSKFGLITENFYKTIPKLQRDKYMDYIVTSLHPFYDNKEVCFELMNKSSISDVVKLSAVQNYAIQNPLNPQKYKIWGPIYKKLLNNNSDLIASNAHHDYWSIRGITGPSDWLQKRENIDNLKRDTLIVILQKARINKEVLSFNLQEKLLSHHLVPIQRLTLQLIPRYKTARIQQYFLNDNLNEFVRMSSLYLLSMHRARNLTRGKPNLGPFFRSSKAFLRSYAYATCAAYGDEVLNYLKRERKRKDRYLVQAAILRSSTLVPIPIVSKDNRKSPQERQEIVRKYWKSKDKNLRQESYRAYTYYSENVDEVLKQYSEKKDAKKGIASAIRHKIRDVTETGNLARNMFYYLQHNNQTNRLSVINDFKISLGIKDKIEKYKKMLSQIEELDDLIAEDYFRWGLICKHEKKWGTAIEKLQSALDKGKFKDELEKLMCLVELAEAEWKKNKSINKNILQQILPLLPLLDTKKSSSAIFKNLLEVNSKVMEKILLECYLSGSKGLYGIIAPLKCIDSCTALIKYYEFNQQSSKAKMFKTIRKNIRKFYRER
ncbi:protein kinase [Candidatus Uabimicrobium sp. HlEnr_7]|uniref:protein kinase domain-containing protein n=1 Tax=Candidatus Uabimicrobium helgolandensis TaxID=3095367 RepID=UPI003557DBD0